MCSQKTRRQSSDAAIDSSYCSRLDTKLRNEPRNGYLPGGRVQDRDSLREATESKGRTDRWMRRCGESGREGRYRAGEGARTCDLMRLSENGQVQLFLPCNTSTTQSVAGGDCDFAFRCILACNPVGHVGYCSLAPESFRSGRSYHPSPLGSGAG